MMVEFDLTRRSFLQQIRQAAENRASGNLNPSWQRAYSDLANAADRLDAMQARCTVVTGEGVPSSIQGEGRPLTIGVECGWADDAKVQTC